MNEVRKMFKIGCVGKPKDIAKFLSTMQLPDYRIEVELDIQAGNQAEYDNYQSQLEEFN